MARVEISAQGQTYICFIPVGFTARSAHYHETRFPDYNGADAGSAIASARAWSQITKLSSYVETGDGKNRVAVVWESCAGAAFRKC